MGIFGVNARKKITSVAEFQFPLSWRHHLNFCVELGSIFPPTSGPHPSQVTAHPPAWTRERAIDFMLENSATGRTAALAEVERYIANPGQALVYKIG